MADITGIQAKEGDGVIIFDKDIPVQVMADAMNTIPYEVLTGISQPTLALMCSPRTCGSVVAPLFANSAPLPFSASPRIS